MVMTAANVPSPAKVAALLSKLLSEQYGLQITVTCELKEGERNGRTECPANDTDKSPSDKTA